MFEISYPLATKNLYLNGREVVWKLQCENNLPSALAMVVRSGQMMMLADEANSFFNKVEFDPKEGALGEACRITREGWMRMCGSTHWCALAAPPLEGWPPSDFGNYEQLEKR